MSDDVTARRARALEALLGPAARPGQQVMDDPGPADADTVEAVEDPREAMMVARIGALLSHPGTWQAQPASATLPEALLAEIRGSEAAVADAPPEPAATPVVSPPVVAPVVSPPAAAVRRRWWPQWRWTPPRLALGVAGALAALLLAVVMFGGDLLGREDGTSRQIAMIELTGTSAAPDAHATLRAVERDAGWRLEIDIEGLAPAAPDEYYQGWAVHDQEMVSLGTFHMHKPGEIELWSGVPLKKYSRIEVTEQRIGAGQTPGVLVMVGQI